MLVFFGCVVVYGALSVSVPIYVYVVGVANLCEVFAAWAWHAAETESKEVQSTVHLVLEWAITVYRSGAYRVLAAMQLLSLLQDRTSPAKNGYAAT